MPDVIQSFLFSLTKLQIRCLTHSPLIKLYAYINYNNYFTKLPAGTSRSGCRSAALPSISVASTMPLDSNPLMTRGSRFTIIGISLPIKICGSGYDSAMPEMICLSSVPKSKINFKSRSAPSTFSTDFTFPIRISIFLKSSMLITSVLLSSYPCLRIISSKSSF